MNVKQFKSLIKEAVREAVREEMHNVLNENRQPIAENKTFNFNSNDEMNGGISADARNTLRAKMGMEFGFQQPSITSNLKLMEPVNEITGEKTNPYLAFIADSAANMTPMDRSGLRNLDY